MRAQQVGRTSTARLGRAEAWYSVNELVDQQGSPVNERESRYSKSCGKDAERIAGMWSRRKSDEIADGRARHCSTIRTNNRPDQRHQLWQLAVVAFAATACLSFTALCLISCHR